MASEKGVLLMSAQTGGQVSSQPISSSGAKGLAAEGPDWALLITQVAHHQDREAFRQIFDFYAPRLKSFYIKGGLGDAKAEELVQEVMVSVWRKANTFDPEKSSLNTWIYTIARNRRIDDFRRNKIDSKVQTEDLDDHRELRSTTLPADRAVALAQEQAHLKQAMTALPAEQADLLKDSFFDSLTHAEIAKKRGLPMGTVKSRVRLALEKLRFTLDSRDFGENIER